MKLYDWIQRLNLRQHSEGGFYKQVYLNSSEIMIDNKYSRALSSSILFLLSQGNPLIFIV